MSKINVTPNLIMASFDVTNMYTNVPVDMVCDFLKNCLDKFDLPFEIWQILAMIKLCIVGTCFHFEDVFYKQIYGLQMGSKLSPIIANLALEIFESTNAQHIISQSELWLRYMDDVYSIWRSSINLNLILQLLNECHPTLKFTLETEEDCTLPFLDLRIVRRPQMMEFKIFRKPSNNLLMINYFSSHEPRIKLSGLISMYLRALNFVSPRYMNEEYDKISEIAKINNYPDHMATIALNKAKSIFYRTTPAVKYNHTMNLCLPFTQSFTKLIYPLKLLGIKLVFKYNDVLINRIVRNSPKIGQACIYAIVCNCNKFYIGQTTLDVKERTAQHFQYVVKNVTNSALNQHYLICNKGINWNQPITIAYENNYSHRNLLETLLIKFTWSNNVNLSVGPVASDRILLHIASLDYKFDELLKSKGVTTRSTT